MQEKIVIMEINAVLYMRFTQGGGTEKDKPIIDDFVKKEPGLSFNPANKNVSTKEFGR